MASSKRAIAGGAAAGLLGLASAFRCPGGSCASCWGCAGTVAVLLLAVWRKGRSVMV